MAESELMLLTADVCYALQGLEASLTASGRVARQTRLCAKDARKQADINAEPVPEPLILSQDLSSVQNAHHQLSLPGPQ